MATILRGASVSEFWLENQRLAFEAKKLALRDNKFVLLALRRPYKPVLLTLQVQSEYASKQASIRPYSKALFGSLLDVDEMNAVLSSKIAELCEAATMTLDVRLYRLI